MEIILAVVAIGLVGYWMWSANKPAPKATVTEESPAPYKVETQPVAVAVADVPMVNVDAVPSQIVVTNNSIETIVDPAGITMFVDCADAV